MQYKYGYARVSTQEQNLDRQIDMLKELGCDEILTEKASGTKKERPELARLKDKLRPGDLVYIESWSRLGRSTKDLLEQVDWFEEHGIQLVSLKENFDTSTPQGKLMLTVFQAFAQFERDLIVQRTREGLASARARGRKGGRPRKKKRDVENALRLYDSREYSIRDICRMTGVSQSTLYRYIAERDSEKQSQKKAES